MKKLTAIFMFILMVTAATFAGTGITATMQGRAASVEIVDGNLYNIKIVSGASQFIGTNQMTQRSGTFTVDIPEGTNYVQVIATNIMTGEVTVIPLRVE